MGLEHELAGRDAVAATEVRAKHGRDDHRTVGLLAILEQRDHEPRERNARGVQQVRALGRSAGFPLEADVRALRLQRAAVGGRGDLEPLGHTGRPGFDIEAAERVEAKVAGASLDDPHRKVEPFEHVDRETSDERELRRRSSGLQMTTISTLSN